MNPGDEMKNGLMCLPNQKDFKIDPAAGYLYYVDNETIDGIEFPFIPKVKKGI